MRDYFTKRQIPIYRTFLTDRTILNANRFTTGPPRYLGRKLIKYQREEEAGGEKKRVRSIVPV